MFYSYSQAVRTYGTYKICTKKEIHRNKGLYQEIRKGSSEYFKLTSYETKKEEMMKAKVGKRKK